MKHILIVLLLVITACSPKAAPPTATPLPTIVPEVVEFEFDDVLIELEQLPGWDVYVKTENHLIMAEGNDPFRTSGGLEGLLVNMWVPSLTNLSVNYDLNQHSIAQVLTLVLHTSGVHSEYAVDDPIPFQWSQRDAAYYTITNSNGNLSMVIALKVADNHFIAVNISAPDGHGARIREALPLLFDPFYINGERLDNSALESLPTSLDFPHLNPISPTENTIATITSSAEP